jgi:hypothetical protein
MAVVMMKAIAHVINPVNDLDNGLMDHHVQVDVDMDQVKPQPHSAILVMLIQMDLNLMKGAVLLVVMIIAPLPQVLDPVVIKVEIHVNLDNLLVIKAVPHVNLDNLLVIKAVPLVNQANPPATKVATLVKKEKPQLTKVKNLAIKAEITLLKNVILNLFFRVLACNFNPIKRFC